MLSLLAIDIESGLSGMADVPCELIVWKDNRACFVFCIDVIGPAPGSLCRIHKDFWGFFTNVYGSSGQCVSWR